MEDVVRRLYHRTMSALGRGRVKFIDDTGPVQMHQVDLGPNGPDGKSLQLHDNVPVVQQFGFASHPPLESDAIAIAIGGDQNKLVVLGHNNQDKRLRNLAEGDAALYDARGAYAWWTPTGLVIDAAGGNVTIQNTADLTATLSGNATITATKVTINGNLVVNGDFSNTGDVSLAGGGPKVARVGDAVSSSLVTGGSSKVQSG